MQIASLALSIPIGEWHNFHADFNPYHNHVNAEPKQASFQITSLLYHHATPKQNTVLNVRAGLYTNL
jgi:hypothetical protein